jgi:hypothetical protein
MASTLPGDYNPYYKQRAGWIGGANQAQNFLVSTSGSYTIGELSSLNKDIKGLFVNRNLADPDFEGHPTFYSVEYRNATWDPIIFNNFNSIVQTWANASKGIIIKIIDKTLNHSYVIPTTKAFPTKQSSSIMSNGFYPFGLQTGEVFFDATVGTQGFRLTINQMNATSAQVTINLTPPSTASQ